MQTDVLANSFEFITDESFRLGLESDYREMLSAFEISAYKSVLILAGSIVEAILIDALIASESVSKEKALRMSLADAIKAAKENGIITETTADLSAVIREYRNLIHPGRSIRLQQTPTEQRAQIAKSLVVIVAQEIEKWKRQHYGYTARQIINKLEKDSSATAILPHLLAEASPTEIERLLLIELPEAFWRANVSQGTPEYIVPAYIQCYRAAFEQSAEELKRKVMNKFVRMLKEETDSLILPYEIAFVRGADLKYLPEADARLVADHLIGRMREVTASLLRALEGIGPFLTKENAGRFIDSLVKVIHQEDSDLKVLARNLLVSEWYRMPLSHDKMESRLQKWIEFYREREWWDTVAVLEEVLAEVEIPF